MTIFLILVVVAGVLFIANVNSKAAPDRSSNLFYGGDNGAGFADTGSGFSDGGGFCSDGGGSCGDGGGGGGGD